MRPFNPTESVMHKSFLARHKICLSLGPTVMISQIQPVRFEFHPSAKNQGGVGGRRLDVVNVQGCRTGLSKDDLGDITFDINYDTELTCSAAADSVSLAYSAV